MQVDFMWVAIQVDVILAAMQFDAKQVAMMQDVAIQVDVMQSIQCRSVFCKLIIFRLIFKEQ